MAHQHTHRGPEDFREFRGERRSERDGGLGRRSYGPHGQHGTHGQPDGHRHDGDRYRRPGPWSMRREADLRGDDPSFRGASRPGPGWGGPDEGRGSRRPTDAGRGRSGRGLSPMDERRGRARRGSSSGDGRGRSRGGPPTDRVRGRGGMPPALAALVSAARQVGLVGDQGQRRAAGAVLEDAARRIYAILADLPAPAPAPIDGNTDASGADPAGGDDVADTVTDA
jgi:hypothetical protein